MSLVRCVKSFSGFAILAAASLMAATPASAANGGPVGRGTAGDFAVLAGSTVTNTGPSVITGGLGLSPGTAITGFPPGVMLGTIHQTDAVALQAKKDLVTAYDDAAGRPRTATISADLGGQTLTPGVYTGAPSLALTGTLTLDGQNDANAVFIFQAPASTLTTASASRVVLIRGAQACNVVWQIGSSATLGTGSLFKGNILALESITVTHGTTVDGSTLARNAAVTLDDNTISRALCSSASTTGGTTATTSPGAPAAGTGGSGSGTGTGTGPNGPGGGTGTTATNGPGGGTGTTATNGPGGGTGTTATNGPGGGTGTTATNGPGGGTTSDTSVRPFGPLAATGAEHSEAGARLGLTLTGLGLMFWRLGRKRRMNGAIPVEGR